MVIIDLREHHGLILRNPLKFNFGLDVVGVRENAARFSAGQDQASDGMMQVGGEPFFIRNV